jgi:hypothetical protein
MMERLLAVHACLQSIGFLLESIQLPLCGMCGSPMLVGFSIAPKLGRLPLLALVPVEVLLSVVLVLEAVFELVALVRAPAEAFEPVVPVLVEVSLLVVLIQID